MCHLELIVKILRDYKMNKPTILIDTREQMPYSFRASVNLEGVEVIKLDFGDYAVKDELDLITIERKKSVIELCGNIGKNRKRFERELERMQEAKRRIVLVEDYWSSLTKKQRFTRMPPNAVFESIIALELKYGVHFILAGTRPMAQRIARSLLVKAYKYRQEGIL